MCDNCNSKKEPLSRYEEELDRAKYIGRLEAEVALLKELLGQARHEVREALSNQKIQYLPCTLLHYQQYTYPTTPWYTYVWSGSQTSVVSSSGIAWNGSTGITPEN